MSSGDFADDPTPIRALDARLMSLEMRIEEADALPGTEWGKRIEADAKSGGDVARAIKRIKALAWGALGTALVGLGSALWFALGVAKASGVSEGVERVREEQRIEAAKRLTVVEEAQAKLSRELSRVLGILDGSRPYRAAPYLGPMSPDQQEP